LAELFFNLVKMVVLTLNITLVEALLILFSFIYFCLLFTFFCLDTKESNKEKIKKEKNIQHFSFIRPD